MKNCKQYIFGFIFAAFVAVFSSQIAAAQTCDVTWRKIDNPHVISGTVTIPAGQNVCIEPGVNVQFTNTAQLHLFGSLVGTGSAAEHITVVAPVAFPNRIEIVGTLDLQLADISVVLNVNARGSLYCRDCTFGRLGIVGTFDGITSHIDTGTRFVSLENVVFDSNEQTLSNNASFFGGNFTATLKNVTFRNSADLFVNTSYMYIDGLTSQDSPSDGLIFTQDSYQPTFFNNLNITNSAGAGLRLDAGNFEIGPNITIQNTEYPVKGRGGLMPNSHIPAVGNRNNWIEVGQMGGRDTIYAPQSVPYVVDLFANLGGVEIYPGTTFKARSNFGFNTQSGALRALGLPGAPITIEPFVPGQKWTSGQFNAFGDRLEYVVLDGSQFGIVSAGGNGSTYWIDNSILKNHDRALISPSGTFAFLQGNLFANNTLAMHADSGIRASGKTNPNLFEDNTTGVTLVTFGVNPVLRNNWWDSPTGPTASNNPGGTGETINGVVQIMPFRSLRPDRTDHPPVVRMPRVAHRYALGYYQGLLDAGSKAIITWQASDDHQIVKQKILFSTSGNGRDDFTLVADNLPAGQRNFELTVPGAGFQGTGDPTFVRVVAVDDKGQEGFDEWGMLVPSGGNNGDLQITSNVAGQTFRGGDSVPLTWTVSTPFPQPQYNGFLILDGDRRAISLGGGNANGTFGIPKMPLVSTDSARFAVAVYGTANYQKWFFSEPFAIRPDPRYIDAAPQITLQTPAAGQQFPAGSAVPISWAATDDEAIRQFNIQASTDGGRTWIEIAYNLPPNTTNYNWQLPSNGSTINDVRVRVVTVDRRFQNTSAGQTRVFGIVAPANAPPSVQITYPANNSSVANGRGAFFAANATDPDGTIQRVEFYQTNSSTGSPTTTLIGSDTTAPYQIAWDTLATNNHTITARAYDDRNVGTSSAPINFNVVFNGQFPLPINAPELDTPDDGQNFPSGSNITLRAAPGTGDRPIVRINFYNGTTLIGSDTTDPYEIVWNNVPQGRYAIFARTVANNGAEATSKQADISVGVSAQITHIPFDFDGDGKADISVFRTDTGTWYLLNSLAGFSAAQFGLSTDKIAPADFDGDGKTDIAVFRPSDGNWYILNSSNGVVTAQHFGLATDVPIPGDFDGDGKADVNVFRNSDGTWYRLNSSNGAFVATQFGANGDKPQAGDFDGDGKADIAVFRPSIGAWYWIRSSNGTIAALNWGLSTDLPVPADYDGDGKTDVAIYRPSLGSWYVLRSSDGGFIGPTFGIAADIPAPGDYDGDGRADVAIFRPSDGTWWMNRTTAGVAAIAFGQNGDKPTPSAFVY